MSNEFRLCVGEKDLRRSSVWKFTIHKNDIYITSRMFGSDVKVSLHDSGQCNYSRTNEWVKKVTGRKNNERHMQQWDVPRIESTTAIHIFRIHFLESELREITPEESLGKVKFVSPPAQGTAVTMECYLVTKLVNDPVDVKGFPYKLLKEFKLLNGMSFLVFINYDAGIADIEGFRSSLLEKMKGYLPDPRHRLSAFTVSENGITRGLIELCTCSH